MDERPDVGGSSMPSFTGPYRLCGLRDWGAVQAEPSAKAEVPTFGAFAEQWMERQSTLAHGGLLRINSLHRYKSVLRAHLLQFFSARPIDSITRARCDGFRMAAVGSGRLNPGTVNGIMQILRLILRAALSDGLIDRDPLRGLRPLRVSPRLVEPYDRSEIRRLISAAPAADRVVIGLAALAGLRQGEVFAIRPGDVDLPGRLLRVSRSLQRHHQGFTIRERLGPPKTTLGYREVPLQAELRHLIEEHVTAHWAPNRHDLLCPGREGEPWVPIDFHRVVFAPAIRTAGLRWMRFHDLRRSLVSQCVSAGIPAAQTAAWLGHTVKMMERYYQVGEAQRATALDLLDRSTEP
jgi:integrase